MMAARFVFLLVTLSLASPVVLAQEGVRWMCWLGTGDDYNIHCLREVDPVLDDAAPPAAQPYDDSRMQAEFSSAGKARTVARVVREAPQRYDTLRWSIPLYSMPFDVKDVELLAQTIMCGNDAMCAVQFPTYQPQVAGR